MIFYKRRVGIALFLTLAIGIFYYVTAGLLMERLERAIKTLAPGSQITRTYAIPIPLLNTVYCGNVKISRPGGQLDLEEYVEIRRLTVNLEKSPEGIWAGLRHVNATLQGVKGSMRGGELAAEVINADFFYRKQTAGNEDGALRVEMPASAIEGLYIQSPSGYGLNAGSVKIAGFSLLTEPGFSTAIRAKTGVWEAILRQEFRLEAIKAESVTFAPIENNLPALTANYLLQGSSGPKGARFMLQASVTKEEYAEDRRDVPVTKNAASLRDRFRSKAEKSTKKAIQSVSLMGINSVLNLEVSIPWGEPDKEEAICDMTVASSGLFTADVKAVAPAPKFAQAAAWADACLQLQPPFFDEFGQCARELGFSSIALRLIDKGILMRAGMAYAGVKIDKGILMRAGMAYAGVKLILGGLGRSPVSPSGGLLGFLLLYASVVQHTDYGSFVQVELLSTDVDGVLHPLRPDLKERFTKGMVKVEVTRVIPGPILKKIKMNRLPTTNRPRDTVQGFLFTP